MKNEECLFYRVSELIILGKYLKSRVKKLTSKKIKKG